MSYDLLTGDALAAVPESMRRVLLRVVLEQERQRARWLEQQDSPGASWSNFLFLMVEEVYRICLSLKDAGKLHDQLVQVAAVVMLWLEALDGQIGGGG